MVKVFVHVRQGIGQLLGYSGPCILIKGGIYAENRGKTCRRKDGIHVLMILSQVVKPVSCSCQLSNYICQKEDPVTFFRKIRSQFSSKFLRQEFAIEVNGDLSRNVCKKHLQVDLFIRKYEPEALGPSCQQFSGCLIGLFCRSNI